MTWLFPSSAGARPQFWPTRFSNFSPMNPFSWVISMPLKVHFDTRKYARIESFRIKSAGPAAWVYLNRTIVFVEFEKVLAC